MTDNLGDIPSAPKTGPAVSSDGQSEALPLGKAAKPEVAMAFSDASPGALPGGGIRRLTAFLEHAAFWGGIGLIAGAMAATVNMAVLFIAGGACFIFAFLKTDPFGGVKKAYSRFALRIAFCASLAAILFFVWRVTPKPKEVPSARENAEAVLALQDKRNGGTKPAVQDRGASDNGDRTEPSKVTSRSPRPASRPPESLVQTTSAEPSTSNPASQPAKLTVSQTSDTSTREDAPFKTQVVVSTDREFPALRLAVECDGPIVAGDGAPLQVDGISEMRIASHGVVNGHSNIFVVTYKSATPTFGPSVPMIINLWSRSPIRCSQATTF